MLDINMIYEMLIFSCLFLLFCFISVLTCHVGFNVYLDLKYGYSNFKIFLLNIVLLLLLLTFTIFLYGFLLILIFR